MQCCWFITLIVRILLFTVCWLSSFSPSLFLSATFLSPLSLPFLRLFTFRLSNLPVPLSLTANVQSLQCCSLSLSLSIQNSPAPLLFLSAVRVESGGGELLTSLMSSSLVLHCTQAKLTQPIKESISQPASQQTSQSNSQSVSQSVSHPLYSKNQQVILSFHE